MLARRMKAAGHRLEVDGTEGLLHTRMYAHFRTLWEGTARQATSLLGRATPVAALGAILLALSPIVLPILAILASVQSRDAIDYIALGCSLAGSLALAGTHIGAARYFRIPFWYGLLFPIGYLLGAGVMLFAFWQRSHGQTRWKGRVYQAAPT